jgi:predicted Zn-dependent peptidase
MDGLDGGFFGAYIACSPEKATRAIEMLEEEFKKLMDSHVSEVEINRSKQYLIGKYHIELQKNSSFTSSILFNDIYGVSSQEVFEYKDRIMSVKTSDILDLAGKIFNQHKVLSAVGKTCPW